ncbi:MAG: surface antigen [Bacteroidota bacterium]|jgi:outer membrane protein assembly factor BamA|nr:surface antigen [Bacteroidota bacterium]
MQRTVINRCLILLACWFIASCSGTKNLPKGEKLYTGADIKLESPDKKIKNRKAIKAAAESAVRPKPNKSFLGMRPKLWLYMAAGEEPKSKIKKWMKKKGEAPVLLSNIKPGATTEYIDAKLFNIGIFKGITEYRIEEKKKTGKVIYTCRIHKQYTLSEIRFPAKNSGVETVISETEEKASIKIGDEYNLEGLKMERVRLDAILKDNGYYYFSPDYLLFNADTNETDRTVSLKLSVKNDTPEKALRKYRINNVYIQPDYSLTARADSVIKDTLKYENVHFLGKRMRIRPKVLLRSVYLKKHELYTRKNHNITLNRLMSMGNFKFVRVNISDSDTTAPDYLDVKVLLTSMPKRTFRSEVDLVTKSNNFTGPRLNLSYLNRNTFNGAELLNLNLAGSIETQISGKYKNLYSYSINPQVEIYVPRFVTPFPVRKTNSMYIPKTRFSIGYNYLKRVNYFDLRTFQFVYGFKWKEDIRKEHELNPVNVNFTTVRNKSAEFEELLVSNPFLRKSYEEQFIAGGMYSYTYNEQVLPNKKVQYYFFGSSEIAGNTFSLARAIGGEKISPDNQGKVIGSVYSQFTRLTVDGRSYVNFRDKNKLVFRLYGGLGKPYGNSSTLPYVKQFFSGGPNSIRAFRINSVGPGTYKKTTEDRNSFLEMGGDIKIESNIEYRYNIIKFLKGALFVDAGNIWLTKANPANQVPAFSVSKFHSEIAVGAGIGLRLDLNFFVLRFDLATPLRKPWLEEGHRWVTDQISFGNPSWRSENLILNVAIGYPF